MNKKEARWQHAHKTVTFTYLFVKIPILKASEMTVSLLKLAVKVNSLDFKPIFRNRLASDY